MGYLNLEEALARMEIFRTAITEIERYKEATVKMVLSVEALSKCEFRYHTAYFHQNVSRDNYCLNDSLRDILEEAKTNFKALEEHLVEERADDIFGFNGCFAAKAVRENLGDPIKLYMSVNPERIPEDNQPKTIDFHGITVECIMLAFDDPNGVGGGAIRMVFGN